MAGALRDHPPLSFV